MSEAGKKITRKKVGYKLKARPAKKAKGPGGRPSLIDEGLIHKLQEAFAYGASDREACFYAGISPSAFYEWQALNPEFKERKEALKEQPILAARKAVVDAVVGDKENGTKPDANLAFRYLERKRRDEFGISQAVLPDGSNDLGGRAPYAGILARLASPEFVNFFRDVEDHRYTHFWEPGGRGATRSTSIGLALVDLLMKNPNCHALVMRQVGTTLRDSVFAQIISAINELGVDGEWRINRSMFLITRIETGQNIYFRGLDDPYKIKSIKPPFGYIAVTWLEEADQAKGEEHLRTVLQSTMRGGEKFWNFRSWNTPRRKDHWINQSILDAAGRSDIRVHHSTYLNVPVEWLGPPFFEEAERLREKNPDAYRHEYLGESVGVGGEVFENLSLEGISDESIAHFDNIKMGLDFGYAVDPLAWMVGHYDKRRKVLFLFNELCATGLSDDKAVELLKGRGVTGGNRIICDSEDPKAIDNFRRKGLFATGCHKFPGSVMHGINYLQRELDLIVIDPARCPVAAREFSNYEYKRDAGGVPIPVLQGGNDHTIDAVRYMMDDEITAIRPSASQVVSTR